MTENRCIEVLKKMKHMFTETCAKIDENTALDMAVETITRKHTIVSELDEIRVKVIDEFAERLKAEFSMVEDEYGATTNLILNKKIDEIAEEMRGAE